MSRYGRYATSEADSGLINSGTMRASVYDPMNGNGWASQIGARIFGSASVALRLAIFSVNSSGQPSSRLAYTGSFAPASTSSLSNETHNIGVNTNGSNPAYEMLFDNKSYAIAADVQGATLTHAMVAAANVTANNENFYSDFGLGSTTPPTTFGVDSTDYEGLHTFWIEYQANRTPTATVTSPSGNISTATPTLRADFTDSDSGFGDQVKQWQFEVQRLVSGSWGYVWQPAPGTASSSDKTAANVQQTYGGTALVPGGSYRVRCMMSDAFGEWGAWSGWVTFQYNSGGTITPASTPTGAQQALTGFTFTGTWNHSGALSMTNAQLKITLKDGTPVFTSAIIAKSAINGAAFNVTQVEAAATNALGWGTDYYWLLAGKDSGGVWTDFYSGPLISTDAAPTIPGTPTPATGSPASSTPPLLTVKFTDKDDTTGTGLTASVRIKNAAGTVLQTRTMTFNATLNRWEYQVLAGANEVQTITKSGTVTGGTFQIVFPTNSVNAGGTTIGVLYNATAATWQSAVDTVMGAGAVVVTGGPFSTTPLTLTYGGAYATFDMPAVTITSALTGGGTAVVATTVAGGGNDFPGYATYKWDASAYDGTLYSGGTTVSGSRSWSTEQSFIFAAGPGITITSPTASAVLTNGQPTITWTLVSGAQASALVQYYYAGDASPFYTGSVSGSTLSYVTPAGTLVNNTSYEVVITVTPTVGPVGSSARQAFSVVYPAVATIPLTATPQALTMDGLTPSAILIAWSTTTYDSSVFVHYSLYRRQASDDPNNNQLLQEFSYGRNSYLDVEVRATISYIYTITQTITQGTDQTTSPPITAAAIVNFPFLVIHADGMGADFRVVVRAWEDYAVEPTPDVSFQTPWGATAPTAIFGPEDSDVTTISGWFVDDDAAHADTYYAAAKNLQALKTRLLLRDNRGDLWKGNGQWKFKKEKGHAYSFTLTFTETS